MAKRFTIILLLALSASVSAHANSSCEGTWYNTSEFQRLPNAEKEVQLGRLSEGLKQGCSAALNGLGYLSTWLPNDYSSALNWYRLLIMTSENQSHQLAIQETLITQLLDKIDELSKGLEYEKSIAAKWLVDKAELERKSQNAILAHTKIDADLKIMKKDNLLSKTRIRELTVENRRLNDVLRSLKDAHAEKLRIVSERNTEIDSLLRRIVQTSDKLKQSEAAMADQTSQLESERVAASNIEASLNDQIERLEGEAIDRKSELEARKNDIVLLTSEALGLRKQISDNKAEIEGLKRNESEILRIREELRVADGRIDEFENMMKGLNNQIAASAEAIEDLNKQLSDTTAVIENLKTRMSELVATNESLNLMLTESVAVNERLEQQLMDSVAASEDLKKRVSESRDELKALTADNRDLEIQLTAASEQVQKLTAANEILTAIRSEFFRRLSEVIGDEGTVRVVGDRFVFQSEVLFETGSASLNASGRQQILKVAETLVAIEKKLKPCVVTSKVCTNWVLQVNGHADIRPISTAEFSNNWELSQARALSIVNLLVEAKISPNHLAAAGYGEFQPINSGDTPEDLAQNRRIEMKITDGIQASQ